MFTEFCSKNHNQNITTLTLYLSQSYVNEYYYYNLCAFTTQLLPILPQYVPIYKKKTSICFQFKHTPLSMICLDKPQDFKTSLLFFVLLCKACTSSTAAQTDNTQQVCQLNVKDYYQNNHRYNNAKEIQSRSYELIDQHIIISRTISTQAWFKQLVSFLQSDNLQQTLPINIVIYVVKLLQIDINIYSK